MTTMNTLRSGCPAPQFNDARPTPGIRSTGPCAAVPDCTPGPRRWAPASSVEAAGRRNAGQPASEIARKPRRQRGARWQVDKLGVENRPCASIAAKRCPSNPQRTITDVRSPGRAAIEQRVSSHDHVSVHTNLHRIIAAGWLAGKIMRGSGLGLLGDCRGDRRISDRRIRVQPAGLPYGSSDRSSSRRSVPSCCCI